ncbi:hypothetical protein PIB30_000441 [Stylosanthes scabra]|uniref:TPX2 central domain-containing protein n=1 Tax=Stylosanthes scabra TaxID=79078 RepID=A0ABU6V0T5_9FABA|nr:hypothetical protein [Stylosanthes scabra]
MLGKSLCQQSKVYTLVHQIRFNTLTTGKRRKCARNTYIQNFTTKEIAKDLFQPVPNHTEAGGNSPRVYLDHFNVECTQIEKLTIISSTRLFAKRPKRRHTIRKDGRQKAPIVLSSPSDSGENRLLVKETTLNSDVRIGKLQQSQGKFRKEETSHLRKQPKEVRNSCMAVEVRPIALASKLPPRITFSSEEIKQTTDNRNKSLFNIRNSPDTRNTKVRELVVSHNSAHNEILGRPTTYKVGAIMTTSILTKKFITDDREGEALREDKIGSRKVPYHHNARFQGLATKPAKLETAGRVHLPDLEPPGRKIPEKTQPTRELKKFKSDQKTYRLQ